MMVDTDDLYYDFDGVDEIEGDPLLDGADIGVEDPQPGDIITPIPKGHYINEHMLTILMSMFRNWDGTAHKSIIFRPDYKEARAKYEALLEEYQSAEKEGCDKRSPRIQQPFMQMLELSGSMYPTDKEIAELYHMISQISHRCVGMYARNKGIEVGDIINTSFERWIKYRHNFDPLKRSEISGSRVNAFAYMTQLIKNAVFETINKINRQRDLELKMRRNMALNESLGASSSVTVIRTNVDGSLEPSTEVFFSSTSEPYDVESEIVGIIMRRAHAFNNMKTLILSVEAEGFSRDEIIKVMSDYELLEPIKATIQERAWDF